MYFFIEEEFKYGSLKTVLFSIFMQNFHCKLEKFLNRDYKISFLFLGLMKRLFYAETIYHVFIFRQFKLSCRAVGVHPPLELSHSLVQFAATALNDVSTATLYVMNSHVSANLFTHAVPRIGSGEVAPVGPTSFEFYVPEDCPVTITPSVGTVLPGKVRSFWMSSVQTRLLIIYIPASSVTCKWCWEQIISIVGRLHLE